VKIIVKPEQAGLRLDLVVAAALGGLSRRRTSALFDTGSLLVNGRRARKGERAEPGSEIEVTCDPELARITLSDPSVRFDVAYEDSHLAVVVKPGGVPTHPNRPGETGTLANGLIARWSSLAGVGHRPFEPGLSHRLDTGTSGLLVVALTRPAFRALRGMFEKGEVEKEYLAVVEGNPPASGTIDLSLAHDPSDRRKMLAIANSEFGVRNSQNKRAGIPDSKFRTPHSEFRVRSWPAVTRFDTIGRVGRCALLRVTIEGGVMHQIRAHLSHAGLPVVGDALYGSSIPIREPPRRFLLHASRVAFAHPVTRARVDVRSPPPNDFVSFLSPAAL
jgi:23S rRNA pseudouridine1911/1915/1917 synthase